MRHGQYRFIVGFLVLPLALYAVFVISPFVQAFYYSLTNWTGVSPTVRLRRAAELPDPGCTTRCSCARVRNNAVAAGGDAAGR